MKSVKGQPYIKFNRDQRDNFYFNIKRLFKERKLTQLDLALDTGVTFQQIAKIYKSDNRRMTQNTLGAIVQYLKVTPDYLLNHHQHG